MADKISEIFAETIINILQNGSAKTKEIYHEIRKLHPDLCDDTIDCFHNGIYYGGSEWMHCVRNVQQSLKRKGLIKLANGKWYLTNL